MAKKCQNCQKSAKNRQKRSKMVKNGQKRSKMVKNGQKRVFWGHFGGLGRDKPLKVWFLGVIFGVLGGQKGPKSAKNRLFWGFSTFLGFLGLFRVFCGFLGLFGILYIKMFLEYQNVYVEVLRLQINDHFYRSSKKVFK